MEIVFVVLLNFAFGKTAMEHIMINALPELPKWEPFYWKDAMNAFGVTCGVYPWACATTVCAGCCIEQRRCCGNGMITIRNACFVYCGLTMVIAFYLLLVVVANVPGCTPIYIYELCMLMIITWVIVQPFEASFLAMFGFGIDTQASDHHDGSAGAASRFDNPMEGEDSDDDPESLAVVRRRHNQAPAAQQMDIIE